MDGALPDEAAAMLIDPDVLREYGHECDRSAGQVTTSHGVLFQDSIIWRDAWDGGVLVTVLQLQNALNDMRDTYDRVRERMLENISAVADDLRSTSDTLRTLAREAEEGEEITRERLDELWP